MLPFQAAGGGGGSGGDATAAAAAAPAPPLLAPRRIAAGDLVIVYESFNSIKSVYVDPKEQFQNRYGSFSQREWLGVPFGSRVLARPPSRGWVYLLAPTAELWTLVLRHRTQILYAADIALVVANLRLRPGCVVLESGTGSGSLTHSLARAVAPTGHVHTFDFHALRAAEAAREFAAHGLGALVTVKQRNVEEDGFPPPEELLLPAGQGGGAADAAFLDLPGPWRVVPSAARSLRGGGVLCAFSPCIEQVQRTCEALDACGFADIRTLEVLLRSYEVSTETLHTDALRAPQPGKAGKKRSRCPAGAGAGAAAAPAAAADAGGAGADAAAAAAAAAARDAGGADGGAGALPPPPLPGVQQVLARPTVAARGHTGYLTFARRFVPAAPLPAYDADEEDAEDGEEEDDSDGGGGGEEDKEPQRRRPDGGGAAAAAAANGGGGEAGGGGDSQEGDDLEALYA